MLSQVFLVYDGLSVPATIPEIASAGPRCFHRALSISPNVQEVGKVSLTKQVNKDTVVGMRQDLTSSAALRPVDPRANLSQPCEIEEVHADLDALKDQTATLGEGLNQVRRYQRRLREEQSYFMRQR